jgi:hypothetical protein
MSIQILDSPLLRIWKRPPSPCDSSTDGSIQVQCLGIWNAEKQGGALRKRFACFLGKYQATYASTSEKPRLRSQTLWETSLMASKMLLAVANF